MNITAQNPSVSVESLSLVAHNNIPVVTTDMLAQLYGTEPVRIQQNHNRNLDRFVEGKHFFKLTGQALKDFVTSFKIVANASKIRSLILWTERGAARHAKMLDTDQAWEVFEKLEDCYFTKPPVAQLALTNGQHFIVAKDGVVIYHKPLSERTSHRYLQPRITSTSECKQAQALLASLQSLPNPSSGEIDYWQLRKALSTLIDHLDRHTPYKQVEPAVTLLRAADRMFVGMWTMIDESRFRVELVQNGVKGNQLSEDRIQTLKNIKHILGLPLSVRVAY